MRDEAALALKSSWFVFGACGILWSAWKMREVAVLRMETMRLQQLLEKERLNRRAEREGRVRVQKELREQMVSKRKASHDEAESSYPFRPIGNIRSCFTERNGTPRQPFLVEGARAILCLRDDLQADITEGLSGYSHCWLLYIFHKNTDLDKFLRDGGKQVKSKVHVPRLNGGKLGVYATRTPHRPCPIGLSVARIIKVDGRNIVLGGCDVVDGTPILDLKPYVPFCDAVKDALAPPWVNNDYAHDPLKMSKVAIGRPVRDRLETEWNHVKSSSLSVFDTFEEVLQLVQQALLLDIRSLYQRLHPDSASNSEQGKVYQLLVDHLDVKYTINAPGEVTVVGVERTTV